jgi:cytidylate kinase
MDQSLNRMRKLIIAIDGPVGSGKSTVARRVAELLGYTYLDSGAMYRALALKAIRRGVSLDSAERLEELARETHIELLRPNSASGAKAPEQVGAANVGAPSASLGTSSAPTPYMTRVLLDGEDVTAAIRTPEMSQAASHVAVFPGVRRCLVAEQQRAGAAGGVVMEGRDIGTVVFPNAELKIFLDASAEVRAERRWREHQSRGENVTLERMVEEVRERDRRDTERDASPLTRAPDAVYVDGTAMSVEETARLIVLLAREKTS